MTFGRIIGAAMIAAATLNGGGCDSSELSPPHPVDALSYPLSATTDPSGRLVWVVSGNFDLGFRGGAVLALDTLTNRFIPELAFEVGSFPGPVVLRTDDDGRAVSAYVASRADDALFHATLTWEADGVRPSGVACPDGAGDILRCPRSGAVTNGRGALQEALLVGDDPFELALIPSRSPETPDLLVSAAMRDGMLATYSLDEAGVPTLIGNLAGLRGTFGLVWDAVTGRLFSTNKSSNAVSIFAIRDRNADLARDTVNPWLTPLHTITIAEFISQTAVRDRSRSALLSADGSRLYVSFRGPDSLLVLDTRPAGDPTRLREIRKIPLSGDAGELALLPARDGRPELVAVSCFDANRVEIVDPAAGQVVASIRTGRGPSGLALVDRPDLGLQRLYVTLFNANAVGVIDLDPNSPTYLTTVAEVR